jgi:hypothetical protein
VTRVDMLTAALAAARRGWRVFPVRRNDKRPACSDWETRATTETGRILRYWREHPDHNIGIACGPSGLLVVDLDRGKPLPPPWDSEAGVVDGADVWAVLRQRHDPDWPAWPSTYTVVTPSGGCHEYYAVEAPPSNTAGRVGPMVDTRGSGGYVVAAGSLVDGRPYTETDSSAPIPPPRWLAELLAPPAPPRPTATTPPTVKGDRYAAAAVTRECELVAAAIKGTRNDTLNRAAYALARFIANGDLARDDVTDALTVAALNAGLEPREIARVLRSTLRARGVAA